MKKYDFVSIGEALIDFTDLGTSENGMKIFERNPGGAPANVACAAARLGLSSVFIGKVGDDMHGECIIDAMANCGVITEHMVRDRDHFTTLAFVTLDENGDRSFSFARKQSADVMITDADISREVLASTSVLHFGSLSFTAEPSKSAVYSAIKFAKENGAVISYDPNYRPLLWESEEVAIEEMRAPLSLVDVIKLSDNECELVCGTADFDEAARVLLDKGIKIVLLTCGGDGARIYFGDECVIVPSEKVKVCDTTGAGDSFLGGFMYKLIRDGKANTSLTKETAKAYGSFANRVAGKCVQKRGAIPALPTLSEVE